MRAGSGAFLDVGVATTADGSVQLGPSVPPGHPWRPGRCGHRRPAAELGVAAAGPRLPEPGAHPAVRRDRPLAARMWTSLTGQPVDGVIALDVAGLRQLLAATGPVQVGRHHRQRRQRRAVPAPRPVRRPDLHAGRQRPAGRPGRAGRRRDAPAPGAALRPQVPGRVGVERGGRPAPDDLVERSRRPGRLDGQRGERQPHPRLPRRVPDQPGREQAGPVPGRRCRPDHRLVGAGHHRHHDHPASPTPRRPGCPSTSPARSRAIPRPTAATSGWWRPTSRRRPPASR